MPFEVRFEDQSNRKLVLAKTETVAEAVAVTRQLHADARAKHLKVRQSRNPRRGDLTAR